MSNEEQAAIAELKKLAAAATTPEEVLAHLNLWEGWSRYHKSIPLGPNEEIVLPVTEDPDPEAVGFAYPLPPIEFCMRNEKKYPPPTDEEAFREMFKLLHYVCKEKLSRRSLVLGAIYNFINSNRRDSWAWQRGFLKAGGSKKLIEFWNNAEPVAAEDEGYPDRYWVVAITGRMMGTCQESRVRLIQDGLVPLILEATKDDDDEIRECGVCSLKGLIQHPEGRDVVTYKTLIDALGS
mmetsp:Transcript_31648/g.57586  ORF Transcript_31648/g.57586 Transcript_31648/m.57586 type:complete len:237 (-) Transcript_31648:98-808(-)|eukprot:CAMPEP_0197656438 /NCGR_PEP_ID=MMETSP1338-20131121/41893_1 /TAXON_ID=43686 ORGANISM="Pelagodinium beii, Strain RCC1491" /NCGR_SAMPLE_ID=MMETSP1338 /ASSEMBLY_ACC=CAM_ASM_000754 /LENGTH=236 /DNA_ID=CAMNT_0043232437 /DNA_START=75 /DNA_END=785 /DNA_ORIENTATION=-